MPTLKAIETAYQGYRFRSRLEARWAVFFDALGVRWEYEKQGYDLGPAGRYLPDFWLPEQDLWVEIKGELPPGSEVRKCAALAEQSQKDVVLFSAHYGFGVPHFSDNFRGSWGICFWRDHSGNKDSFEAKWVQCRRCDKFFIDAGRMYTSHVARHNELPGAFGNPPTKKWYGDVGSPALQNAYAAALSARFEFGETPRV